MKDGLKYLVGKRIAGVVVASSKRSPQNQVFLVFTDGTRFEFYGADFSCCSGLDDARGIKDTIASNRGEIERVYHERRGRKEHALASPESVTGQMERDLAAWRMAKETIAKAKG